MILPDWLTLFGDWFAVVVGPLIIAALAIGIALCAAIFIERAARNVFK